MRIPLLAPTFPSPADVERVYAEIVASGTFSNGGPKERALTAAIAAAVGPGTHASLTANATLALQLACSATFDRSRPHVLMPSFTFAAGALASRWCGHQVVFLDVDRTSWQADLGDAADYLRTHSGEVGGMLLTQTFGVGTEDIDGWEALARRFEVPLVIDSAAGFGGTYPAGEPLGGRGDCEVFSMHATKVLAVGEGGVVTSRRPDLIAAVDQMKNFGFDEHRAVTRLGMNAKLAELPAAIGLLQLQALPDRLDRRRMIIEKYRATLAPLGFELQPNAERGAPAFASALAPDAALRDVAREQLAARGVETRIYYDPPLHRHPLFADAPMATTLEVTEDLASRMVSLPMADRLPDAAIELISDGVAAAMATGGGRREVPR